MPAVNAIGREKLSLVATSVSRRFNRKRASTNAHTHPHVLVLAVALARTQKLSSVKRFSIGMARRPILCRYNGLKTK